MSDHDVAGGFDWEGAEDFTVLSEAELKGRLGVLVEEERAVSYRLEEVLRGRIDLIRAELVGRGGAALSPEELVRVLLEEDGRP